MTLDTLEKLLKQANQLSPNEQLLLATRLIERARQVNVPAKGKTRRTIMAAEHFIGMWRGREEMLDSSKWIRELRQREWGPTS